jgi:hypothetical protein
MSANQFKKVVAATAQALADQEQFSTKILAHRVRQAAEADSGDSTLVAMSNFLTARANKELFISRSELKSAYHKLYARNNKFGSLFASELGVTTSEAKAPKIARDVNEGKSLIESAYETMADPVLANALTACFDKTAEFKPYAAKTAIAAEKACLFELNCLNVSPKKIDVIAGQADLILCQATYETPKGLATVVVPVEIANEIALRPTMFLTQAGFMDLAKKHVEAHLEDVAGKTLRVDAQKCLQLVSLAKNGQKNTISEIDFIIAKAKAAQGNSSVYANNGIVDVNVDVADLDLKLEPTEDSLAFGAKLATPKGAAEFMFGKQVVDAGRQTLLRSLKGFGIKEANVSVLDADKNNIYFVVQADQVAFKVPMKVANGLVQTPKFVMASGNLHEFSREGLEAISTSNVDTKTMAAASAAYGMKSSELIERVRVAMIEDNYAMAEDALNVLHESQDAVAYKAAQDIYLAGMNGTLKVASSCCSKQRKVAYSKHVICGHTNLPVYKVYQDKNGECQPLYRKHIAAAEGGSFLTSKVYFG